MRPKTILWFERLSLAAWMAGMLNALTTSEIGRVMNGPDEAGAAIVIFGSLIVTLALILRVSRWRSRLAKWILIIFTLLLLLGNMPVLLAGMDLSAWLVRLGVGAIQLGGWLCSSPRRRVPGWPSRGPSRRRPQPWSGPSNRAGTARPSI